jgi:hypothetical protein
MEDTVMLEALYMLAGCVADPEDFFPDPDATFQII